MSSALGWTFWEFREHFKGRMAAAFPFIRKDLAITAETADRYRADSGPSPVDERLVQAIWAHQLLQPAMLRTADGRQLRVLDPGRWNHAAGPDFLDAWIMLGEVSLHGAIEVHLTGPDWERHGHDRDLDYNGVVLHVVLRSGDARTDNRLHNGTRIPRLELEPYLFPDLETVRQSLSQEDWEFAQPAELGRCHRVFMEMPASELAEFLDRAGEERLLAKTARLDDENQSGTAMEQVFYQALMTALGAGPSKTLYYLLAKRTPLAEMLDYVRELPPGQWNLGLESLLLHVAGLVPVGDELAKAPDESRRRSEQLDQLWTRYEPFWADRVIPPTRRWFQGLRPVNFPVRRLAGVAILLARAMQRGELPLADFCRRIEAGAPSLTRPTRRRHPLITDLAEAFTIAGDHHFWGNHYSFTARTASRTMRLIGDGTALSLVLNALAPVALLAARRGGNQSLAEAVRALFGLVPPLQDNHITQFMTRRLFGERPEAIGLINTERRRQALFQIFYTCCNGQERHCNDCYWAPRNDS